MSIRCAGRYAPVVGLLLLTAGCGGGSAAGGPAPSAEQLASGSVTGLLRYANDLIGSDTAESSEPRDVDAVFPPQADSDEPQAL